MYKHVWMGIHIVRTVSAIFPYLCFGKRSHSWSNIECRPDVLLKSPNECKLEQFEASRHRGRSGRKVLVFRTDGASDSGASGRSITSSGRLQVGVSKSPRGAGRVAGGGDLEISRVPASPRTASQILKKKKKKEAESQKL
jgi:hypothetical protein